MATSIIKFTAALALGGLLSPTPSWGADPASGLWHFWRSSTPNKPAARPKVGLCLTASEAKDIAVLTGEIPGDSTCRPINAQRGTSGASYSLLCAEGKPPMKVVSTFSENEIRTQVSADDGANRVTYVFGQRVADKCVK
ncbi:MAG: hypothetical protein ACRCV9_19365 [Burkholderiaceae bacterium]